MKSRFLLTLCATLGITPVFGAVTITVNTTTDEFGENPANCSLREAIESVNTHSAFGGCTSGQRFGTNTVKLEAKEYVLTRGEINLKSEITITGIGAKNDEKDTITNTKPKRHAPTTTINAQGKSRFFNSSTHRPALTLNSIKLTNGFSNDIGGAILAGGAVSTFNVVFENNTAKQDGGAVYLIGKDSALTTSSSLWKNNQVTAGSGAALAMSCRDDLKLTARTITLAQSSFVQNGNGNAQSVIDACGVLTLNINTSTIGENTANNAGAIIRLNNNTSEFSSVSIVSSTFVQNKAAPVINFNKTNSINSNFSVIAFNEGEGCVGSNTKKTYSGQYNLLQNCSYLSSTSNATTSANNVVLASPSPVSFSNEFNPLGNYGGFTPTYLPKLSSQYVLNKGGACTERTDQRASSYLDAITCDLGAVERRVAMAIVDRDSVITNNKTTDRSIEISVLGNDIPSETDLTDDQANARGAIAKNDAGDYLFELTDNSNGQCTIIQKTAEKLLPIIRFSNGGKLLSDTQNAACKYTFTDSNGIKPAAGELLFKVQNKPPIAENDTFTLPSEAASVALNVTANDNDSNDGPYGGLCSANNVKCNGGYYIRIVSNPTVGIIEGDRRECPDYTETNKNICYRGNLTYRPKNTLSPFNDSFTYVVYDTDLDISAAATVTILNQTGQSAQENGSAGSLGWFAVITLTGLAFVRRRKNNLV